MLIAELQSYERPWDAARVLGEIGPRLGLVQKTAELLQSESDMTREYAAEALGVMGRVASGSKDALRGLLDDESHEVIMSAEAALERIAAAEKEANQ